MSVQVKDYSQQVQEKIHAAVKDALEKVGNMAVDNARSIVPVDTGALRDSIASQVDDNGSMVLMVLSADPEPQTGRAYAGYVELGTSTQSARPYLKPAIMDHANEYADVIARTVRDAIK